MDLIDKWKSQAKAKSKENQNFLKRLKKSRNSKQIDEWVNEADEEAFERIDCLACANCCKTISPVVTTTDVKRIASALRMKTTEVVETYLKVDHEGDYVMNSQPCPFLGSDNYCSIYEHRPKGCRDYPLTHMRGFTQRPALHHKNTLTCPAVFHVVETLKEKMTK
ncbi:YkgJ family cysteine cluster protein [Limibacter armeniacum]|uniref:YkgJ family cysteine cluster protein n=1 Tax=Limibacter armeniacum TaxID=466084 RepID=UPI002FE5C9BE